MAWIFTILMKQFMTVTVQRISIFTAWRNTLKYCLGAVDLLLTHGSNPETEIDKVTTPGGITIRGLNKMEEEGFTSAVIKGLKASK